MKTLVSNDTLKCLALCVSFLSALPMAQGAEPITITMTADQLQTKENAEFLRELGFYHGLMRLNSRDAVLKDTTFSDGRIEFAWNAQLIQVPMSPGHFDTGTSETGSSAVAPQLGEFLGAALSIFPRGC
jgi:hypothetical protein